MADSSLKLAMLTNALFNGINIKTATFTQNLNRMMVGSAPFMDTPK